MSSSCETAKTWCVVARCWRKPFCHDKRSGGKESTDAKKEEDSHVCTMFRHLPAQTRKDRQQTRCTRKARQVPPLASEDAKTGNEQAMPISLNNTSFRVSFPMWPITLAVEGSGGVCPEGCCQKESDMVGVVKEETRIHVAHYSCCGGLRRSVPKAVVGAPSPTSLRCRPGRGMPLKGLSSRKASASHEESAILSTPCSRLVVVRVAIVACGSLERGFRTSQTMQERECALLWWKKERESEEVVFYSFFSIIYLTTFLLSFNFFYLTD